VKKPKTKAAAKRTARTAPRVAKTPSAKAPRAKTPHAKPKAKKRPAAKSAPRALLDTRTAVAIALALQAEAAAVARNAELTQPPSAWSLSGRIRSRAR
jgi:hypothetical protein